LKKYWANPPLSTSESFLPLRGNVAAVVFPNTFQADFFTWATIAVLSYRLPFRIVRIRPFASVSYIDIDDNVPNDNLLNFAFGINWRISGSIALKVEHQWSIWPNRRNRNQTYCLRRRDATLPSNARENDESRCRRAMGRDRACARGGFR
jgi:hypothetical protein